MAKTGIILFHKLICETFHGPKPSPSHHAAHKNGDRLDNRASNLYWATPKENEADKARHGRRLHGELANGAKLTLEKVAQIRHEYDTGLATQRQLAHKYGVCQRTINVVVNRITWKG